MKSLYIVTASPRTTVYFIKLDLADSSGKLLSTNFYWQNVAQDEYEALADMPGVKFAVEATSHVNGGNTLFDVTVKNPTQNIALMTHLQLHQKATGKRVLPVFYSDNYMSLAPRETRTVTIEAATKDIGEMPSYWWTAITSM